MLVKDVGDRVRNSGKWPAVIDVSGQASVFLRYMVRPCLLGCNGKDACFTPECFVSSNAARFSIKGHHNNIVHEIIFTATFHNNSNIHV